MHTFQPMRLGGILDATLSLYRNNLRLFLGIAAIYFVLYAIGVTLLYFDLRIRKEGFDIEMRVHNS